MSLSLRHTEYYPLHWFFCMVWCTLSMFFVVVFGINTIVESAIITFMLHRCSMYSSGWFTLWFLQCAHISNIVIVWRYIVYSQWTLPLIYLISRKWHMQNDALRLIDWKHIQCKCWKMFRNSLNWIACELNMPILMAR